MAGAGRRSAGDRPPAGACGVDDLTRAAAQRRHARRRPGLRATTAQWHAERAGRRPKPAKLATNAALRTYVQDRLAGAIVAPGGAAVPGPAVPWKGRRQGRRQHGGGPGRGAREQIAQRLRLDLPGRRDDAHQPRGHLPGALRAGPRRVAARADGLPAHRAGAARAAGAQPRTGQVPCRSRGHDQPAPGGSGRPGGAGALGGGSHPRLGQLGDRHAGGAHDAVHDAAASAPHGGARLRGPREERAGARRARRRGGARGDHAHDHHPARGSCGGR